VEGAVELARQHWEDGYRRLERTKEPEPTLYARLLEQVEIVTAELRRRIGKSFTLAELAGVYGGADRWVYEAVSDQRTGGDWLSSASTAADAAFHLYARAAQDYRP
jgi:hypothetical protein